jgi:NAD-dependent SIR2 family protein deacetylase
MTDPDPAIVTRIVAEMRRARRLLFITGAGISADSGLPTYRGIGGLYNDQTTEDSFSIETALSGSMLEMRPEITWKYLHQIEHSCRGACFNDAHAIIAELQNQFEVCVLTQNIDGFHRDAGSRNLIEIHGDIHDLHCTRCRLRRHGRRTTARWNCRPPARIASAPVRPRVVLFGEMLPSPTPSSACTPSWTRGSTWCSASARRAYFPTSPGRWCKPARWAFTDRGNQPDRHQRQPLRGVQAGLGRGGEPEGDQVRLGEAASDLNRASAPTSRRPPRCRRVRPAALAGCCQHPLPRVRLDRPDWPVAGGRS